MPAVTHLGAALIPVFVFLLVLVLMDSFKLVRPGTVVVAIGIGGGVALVCLLRHGWMLIAGVPRPAIRYYMAPLTEKTLKAAFIVLLIARRRVGFLVDAAVQGFAVGAGFALVENVDSDDDLCASLAELEYLRSSIGTTGLLALKPLQVTSRRDEWHGYLLKASAK